MRDALLLSLLAGTTLLTEGRPAAWPSDAASVARRTDPSSVQPSVQTPTLVVVLVVDQMRADYLDRFGPQLTGGLARLTRGGAVLTQATHDHAITETAPGHATILSGRFPRSTGIIGNILGVDDPESPLVAPDSGMGDPASPRRFRGTTLADWMVARDARTQVLSVSRKDRGAILPVGRARAGTRTTAQVYWYVPTGDFSTSRWYAPTLPAWVQTFNARALPQHMAGRVWSPLLGAGDYPEAETVPTGGGRRSTPFPHALPTDADAAADAVRGSPFMDELTLAFAMEGVRALRLGASARADLLVVSLSSTDAVGHGYGPDSRELHDQVLRLDRSLGAFLDTLFAMRDSSRVLVALTADHGVTRYPELAAADPQRAAGVTPRRVDPSAAIAPLMRSLQARGLSAGALVLDNGALFVDRRALASAGLREDAVLAQAESALVHVPGVRRVDRLERLARADTVRDAVARRWLHSVPPDYPISLVVTLDSGSVWSGRVAGEHGSPYDEDARVPLVLWGASFRPGRYDQPARVVDLAPTLARVLGVRPAERMDGRVLEDVLRRP